MEQHFLNVWYNSINWFYTSFRKNYLYLAGPERLNLIDNIDGCKSNISQLYRLYFSNINPIWTIWTQHSSVKAHLTVSNEADKGEFVTFNVTDITNVNNNYRNISRCYKL